MLRMDPELLHRREAMGRHEELAGQVRQQGQP